MNDDIELIEKCERGDREAFNELVTKYQKPLYSMLYKMVSDHDDASDILQKTFVKAFVGLAGFERRSSFKTWLYQIAINLVKNVYRDRARAGRVSLDDVVIGKNPKTVESLIQKQERNVLAGAMARLPEKQKITLMLRVREEKKFEEIAEIMQCSLGTAKANYHHAVQNLKKMIGETEGKRSQESGVRSQE